MTAEASAAMELRSFAQPANVLTSTANDIPGYEIERVLGTVYGLTCRSASLKGSIATLGRAFIGGEMKQYSRVLYSARNEAVDRLVGECIALGGNALVAMRFETGMAFEGIIQAAAYGTAVVVRRVDGSKVREAKASGIEA